MVKKVGKGKSEDGSFAYVLACGSMGEEPRRSSDGCLQPRGDSINQIPFSLFLKAILNTCQIGQFLAILNGAAMNMVE